MDLSTLERSIDALETSLDSLAAWLLFWTALVVVGLIIEYVPEFVELRRDVKRKKLFTLVGGVLITVGVAGELAVEFKASRVETTLRSQSRKYEGLLNEKAGDAGQAAGDANERAGVDARFIS
jgi:hypothetical protein